MIEFVEFKSFWHLRIGLGIKSKRREVSGCGVFNFSFRRHAHAHEKIIYLKTKLKASTLFMLLNSSEDIQPRTNGHNLVEVVSISEREPKVGADAPTLG
jgi:hypothetical protein